jgi:transposase
MLIEQRFPRIWIPSLEQRDARQLVLHRHRLVQMRTRIKNQVQALAMNEGLQRKHRWWSAEGRQELMQLSCLRGEHSGAKICWRCCSR